MRLARCGGARGCCGPQALSRTDVPAARQSIGPLGAIRGGTNDKSRGGRSKPRPKGVGQHVCPAGSPSGIGPSGLPGRQSAIGPPSHAPKATAACRAGSATESCSGGGRSARLPSSRISNRMGARRIILRALYRRAYKGGSCWSVKPALRQARTRPSGKKNGRARKSRPQGKHIKGELFRRADRRQLGLNG